MDEKSALGNLTASEVISASHLRKSRFYVHMEGKHMGKHISRLRGTDSDFSLKDLETGCIRS
jgi:hypothetical protein